MKTNQITISANKRTKGIEFISGRYGYKAEIHVINEKEETFLFHADINRNVHKHNNRATIELSRNDILITDHGIFRYTGYAGTKDVETTLTQLQYQETIEIKPGERNNGIELEKIEGIKTAIINASSEVTIIENHEDKTTASKREPVAIISEGIIVTESGTGIMIIEITNEMIALKIYN